MLDGDRERAQAEWPQAVDARERAFREEHQRPPGSSRLERLARILDAAFRIVPLHEQRAERAQERAGDELRIEFPLGDNRGFPRQDGGQD